MTGECIFTVHAHSTELTDFKLINGALISASGGTVKKWSAMTRECLGTLESANKIKIIGNTLLACNHSMKGSVIKLYDLETFLCFDELKMHDSWVMDIQVEKGIIYALTDNGRYLETWKRI